MTTYHRKYVSFMLTQKAAGRRVTDIWMVQANNCGKLGEIKWWSAWRKYGFIPEPGCVFEEVCLRDIAEFIEDLTAGHKAQRPFRLKELRT